MSEFYIEGTEPVQQCAGQFGAAADSTHPAPGAQPAPFGGQPVDVNTVRPHAAPVPAPSPPKPDTARTHFDPFHPSKP